MQDRAVTEIGKWAFSKMPDKEPYSLYVENMFPKKEKYSIALICFEQIKEVLKFKEVDLDNVTGKNYAQFAYRKGSARGGDITFTTKLSNVEKKLNTLFTIQLPKLVTGLEKSKFTDDYALFKKLYECFEAEYSTIEEELTTQFDGMDKKEQQALGMSLLFIIDGKKKYLGSFESIKQLILESGTEGKSNKYGVISEGKDATCSICLKEKEKLHGFAAPFKYSTVDKKGFVSGFFNQKKNWQNYPICPECALEFEIGQKYISNNLNKYFFGKSYFMIPKTIIKGDQKNLAKAIKLIVNTEHKEAKSESILAIEDYLMKSIGKEENQFSLNMLFFEENPTTKAMKIKLMLEEIMPSRFDILFNKTPELVNYNKLYEKAITRKKEKMDLVFGFSLFRDFFQDDFFGIVQKVFLGIPISMEYVYSRFMHVIRSNHNKSMSSDGYVEYTRLTILKAHILINYLQKLKIIEFNADYNINIMEESKIKEEEKGKVKKPAFNMEKYEEFLNENINFLDADYKKGIFSVGVLVRLLLNIQAVELSGGTPFEKKLKGYNLNRESLNKIYLEALSKISAYKNYGTYANLRKVISDNFTLKNYQLAKLSNNELSFYFVAGLELGNQFKREKEPKEGKK